MEWRCGGNEGWQTRDSRAWASWADSCCGSGELGGGEDVVIEAKGKHRCTVVWLHSCHGNPCNVEGLVDDLRARGILDNTLRIVAPCAPSRPAGSGWSGTSLQWFEYGDEEAGTAPALLADAHWWQLRMQRRRLLRLLEDELYRLPRDGRLVLGGLSQGGSMALDVVLNFRSTSAALTGKLQGIFLRRSILQPETVQDSLAVLRPAGLSLRDLPTLATHGSEDELVAIDSAWRSYGFLRDRGASLQFERLEGVQHNGYSQEEDVAVAEFVRSLLWGWGLKCWARQGGPEGYACHARAARV